MHLFAFLDKIRAESDYPASQLIVSHEHEPDPRTLPDDFFDKDSPKPTEDDRDSLRWDVEVAQYGDTATGKRTFAVVTDRQLNVLEVLVEGPKADYLTTAFRVATEMGVV